jgi:2-C-methyl-D-erythritol 2,4-cyclodiphosphate synthase
MKIRVGFGFDVHQMVAGRELWLGVSRHGALELITRTFYADLLIIPFEMPSGSRNMRDIGYHFPDPQRVQGHRQQNITEENR